MAYEMCASLGPSLLLVSEFMLLLCVASPIFFMPRGLQTILMVNDSLEVIKNSWKVTLLVVIIYCSYKIEITLSESNLPLEWSLKETIGQPLAGLSYGCIDVCQDWSVTLQSMCNYDSSHDSWYTILMWFSHSGVTHLSYSNLGKSKYNWQC